MALVLHLWHRLIAICSFIPFFPGLYINLHSTSLYQLTAFWLLFILFCNVMLVHAIVVWDGLLLLLFLYYAALHKIFVSVLEKLLLHLIFQGSDLKVEWSIYNFFDVSGGDPEKNWLCGYASWWYLWCRCKHIDIPAFWRT